MKVVPRSIQRLIREFNKLPGIGSKTSERFVYHLLRQEKADIEALAHGLLTVKESIRLCSDCHTFTEEERCHICRDSSRDRSIICVVAEPKDVFSLEKAGVFEGVYHVLGGVINHSEGVSPEMLRISELVGRLQDGAVQEVVLGLNPDMEGETTGLYIAQQLKALPVRVTKIARGLPVGGDIEYADEVTLGAALSARQQMN